VLRVYARSARANASGSGSAPGRSRAKNASQIPIRNGSRGSPTWFDRTAGGYVKKARKAAACATSHSRAATGPAGVKDRRARSMVFSAKAASTARGGRRAGREGEGAPASGVSVASSMASLARSEAQSNTRKLILSCRSREFVDFTHQSTRVSAPISRSQSSQRGHAGWQTEPVTEFLIGSGCLRREHAPLSAQPRLGPPVGR
jgi:hypothetical protein